MSISFVKYNVASGDRVFNLPHKDIDVLYGPGWPIAPLPRPEDNDLPHEIDYPITVNATLQPRVGYEGLMPVNALKAAYDNITEVRNPVNLVARMLPGFRPTLRDLKTQNQVKAGHPFEWMTKSPDRKMPFSVWFKRFIKSSTIYAAPALYLHRDNNGIDGLEYIDGSTLFLIINTRGVLPEPDEIDPEVKKYIERIKYAVRQGDGRLIGADMPELARTYLTKANERQAKGLPIPITTPAYTQIIKGVPYSFWDKSQIWFVPQEPATNSPYGESFIESAWAYIQLIAVMTAFELGHYTTGNMPEGFMTLPKDMFPTMGKITLFEGQFNARQAAGSQLQHARIRMAPDGTKYQETKKPLWPQELYKQANENILHSIGIPPSATGQRPGAGLGGAGFEQGAAHDLTNQLLEPLKTFYETPFNYALEKSGVDDAEFYLDYPQEELDPGIQAEQRWQGLIHGDLTLNDALSQQGKQPIGDPNDKNNIANMHMITVGSSIYIVEKMTLDASGLAVPMNAIPGQAGGAPIGPEDAALAEGGDGHTPDDNGTLREALRQLELTAGKSISNKTYWLPTTTEPSTDIDPAEFEIGLQEEQEHAETVGNDQQVIRQIVLDHLREDPHYYSRLRAAGMVEKRYAVEGNGPYRVMNTDTGEMVPGGEHDTKEKAVAHMRALWANVEDVQKVDSADVLQKHCGVCEGDEQYFNAPVSRAIKFTFPKNHHANSVEIIAMSPEGLPPQPALWKPEGGEKESLAAAIGGPQYVREETVYLLDRCLGFHLVPVAYVAEADGERGAAIWYTAGDTKIEPLANYAPEWIERAGVLDYISSQQDRPANKNFLTHPDDPHRMILIDNGFSFPTDPAMRCQSVFCAAMDGKPLQPETLRAVQLCIGDAATWADIREHIGDAATEKALGCAREILAKKRIVLG